MQIKKSGPEPLPESGRWIVHVLIAAAVLLFFRDILSRTSFFWNDFLYQYYAFRSFAATSLAAGDLPLWNPYTFSGMPFQADIQSAIFYVPNLVLTLFVDGGRLDYWWVEVSIILHFALAGSGMYMLARELGLGRWPAAFSGLVYCFSGFMVGHLIHQGFIYQAAWFPLVFLTFRRALLGRSLRYAIVCGLLLGHALLAGAPQITLYIVLFLFCYFLFEMLLHARAGSAGAALRIVPYAAVPIVLAALVTAVQLLPTAELAPLSQRAEISYEKASEGSLAWSQFIMVAVPHYFGTNTAQASEYKGPGDYWQYWETNAYIGIAGLVFAIAAVVFLRRDPLVLFLAAMTVFAFLYALGNNFFLHRLFHEYVPRFDNFRVPGRMVLYVCFAGSILAGFGLQRVAELASDRAKSLRTLASCVAVAAAVLFIAGQAGVLLPALQGAEMAAALDDAALSSTVAAGFLLVLAGLIFLAGRGRLPRAAFIALVLALQFADAHNFGFTQNNGTIDPDQYYGTTKQFVDFFRERGRSEFFRINSRQEGFMIFDRNQGMVDKLFLMEGYTPLGLARFVPPMSTWDRTCELMNAKYRIVVDEASGTMSIGEAIKYFPRAFMVHGSYVADSAAGAKARVADPAFDPAAEVVFEAPPPVVYDDSAAHRSVVTISSYRLNEIRLSVETPADGYLVLSEVWYPGWRAYVDGVETPVLRADWCLRAVPLAAGKHAVTVEFSPSSFRTGAWVSSLTLALSIAGIAFGRKKEDA